MEFSTDFDKQPGVIDETVIYNAIVSQGPKGEEGKLFKEQGINYEEVEHIRLEFLDILKIDHVSTLTGLTKLKLSNNIIEKIENIDMLVNLKELDLSFNNISKIQNLDNLVKLEVLTLFENKITKLDNLEHLKKLRVFSIGNNRLSNKMDLLYLRQFEQLRSLNLTGNPLCRDENFHSFVYAYLPKLAYYEYRLIQDDQRHEARKLFGAELIALEEEEAIKKLEEIAIEKEQLQEETNKMAFVEYLGGHQLFTAMFQDDTDGNAILEMGDEMMDTYMEFMKNFSAVTKELHEFGLKQYETRKSEIEEYETSVKSAKETIFQESRSLLEDFLTKKNSMFANMRKMLDSEETENGDNRIAQLSIQLQDVNETFQELCMRTWHLLMHKQLYLFEAMEKVNGTLERCLTQQVNELVEAAQTKFTQLRSLQVAYHESTKEITDRYFTRLTLLLTTNKDASSNISPELLQIMSDRETIANAISTSHDAHLQVIDRREDQLLSSVRTWLRNYLDNLVEAEINRNRKQIVEMNHFLDSQRADLQALTSVSMPTEIEDALQIG